MILTFKEMSDGWYARNEPWWAPNTRKAYRMVLDFCVLPTLGTTDPRELSQGAIREHLGTHVAAGRAGTYIRLILAVIRGVLEYGVDERVLLANPAHGVGRKVARLLPPPPDRDGLVLAQGTGKELIQHVAAIHREIAWVVATYRSTGCRRAEALGLQTQDIDFRNHRLHIRRQWVGGTEQFRITKGKRARTIDLSRSLEAKLIAAMAHSREVAIRLGVPTEPAWVFRSERFGLPWHPSYVGAVLAAAGRELRLPAYSAKAFRHAVLTHLANTERLKYARDLAGHRRLSTTEVYVHGNTVIDRDAVDGLDEL